MVVRNPVCGVLTVGRKSLYALFPMVDLKSTSVHCKSSILWAASKKVSWKIRWVGKMSPRIFLSVSSSLTSGFSTDQPGRYTTNVIVTDSGEVSTGASPVQVLFCLKEQNKKKLNSHRWFFNAFGPLINPNGKSGNIYHHHHGTMLTILLVCVLLDVGTKPTGTSIYELWKCWEILHAAHDTC